MNRKAPWIAVVAFMAFSAGAIANDNDSSRATRNAIEEGLPGPIENDPRLSNDDTQTSRDSRVVSGSDTQAVDNRVMSNGETRLPSEETRLPSEASSSSRAAATAPSFAQVDRDSNGVLDVREANDAGINFTAANQDEDGVISMREYHFAIAQMGLEPAGS